MCRKMLAAPIGTQGLHFYTMNLERGSRMLLEAPDLVPRVETATAASPSLGVTPSKFLTQTIPVHVRADLL